jgi:hypothetical protein
MSKLTEETHTDVHGREKKIGLEEHKATFTTSSPSPSPL